MSGQSANTTGKTIHKIPIVVFIVLGFLIGGLIHYYVRLSFLIGTLEIVSYIHVPEVAKVFQSVVMVTAFARVAIGFFDWEGCKYIAVVPIRHPFCLVSASADAWQKIVASFAPSRRASHGFIVPFVLAFHGQSVFDWRGTGFLTGTPFLIGGGVAISPAVRMLPSLKRYCRGPRRDTVFLFRCVVPG
jgi:hypothetical protein